MSPSLSSKAILNRCFPGKRFKRNSRRCPLSGMLPETAGHWGTLGPTHHGPLVQLRTAAPCANTRVEGSCTAQAPKTKPNTSQRHKSLRVTVPWWRYYLTWIITMDLQGAHFPLSLRVTRAATYHRWFPVITTCFWKTTRAFCLQLLPPEDQSPKLRTVRSSEMPASWV